MVWTLKTMDGSVVAQNRPMSKQLINLQMREKYEQKKQVTRDAILVALTLPAGLILPVQVFSATLTKD